MSESHAANTHHGPSLRAYLMVFGALSCVTLITFLANLIARYNEGFVMASFVIILTVAFFKATLVVLYFMHILFDWRQVYMLILPALALGPMLIIVLLPDIVLAWK
ncbi:MAG: cytochrome C oxidase subunit IV family protein [Gemmataceae bacterium]|nr:cytochrome C oxidase subunit IV family protein [Gemmataceae bacterium]MDW8266521.1 cytochrome C oxidase subunit IV family protein [Gemmataceae bacterium]